MTERPASPASSWDSTPISTQDLKDSFFFQTSNAIKSFADKPASFYHKDSYLAFVLFAQKIFHEILCATNNRGIIDNSPDFTSMKADLLKAAEALVSDLKTHEDSLGLNSSMHAPPTDPLMALSESFQNLTKTVQSIDDRLTKLEGRPVLHRPRQPTAATPVPASQRSYASAVSNNSPSPPSATKSQPRSQPARPPLASNSKPKILLESENVRIVIRCSKAPRSANPSARLPPRTIADRVNAITAKAGPNVIPKVIGANWNRSNNIILTYPPGTNAAYTIDYVKHNGIFDSLGIPADTLISEDVPWSKIMITHVPTGFGDECGVFSDAQVSETFHSSNEWAKKIRFTQQPRWLKKPDSITKTLSSVVASFEDPDGSIIREFLRKPIFMFNTLVRVKRWDDKPVLQGCTKCLALNHDTSTCKRQIRCDHCAGNHATEDHRRSCKSCRREETALGTPCPHPPKCANCRGPHRASDTSCPERAKFRKPPMSQPTHPASRSDEDMSIA